MAEAISWGIGDHDTTFDPMLSHNGDKLQTQAPRPKPHVHYTVTERILGIESSVSRTHREGMGEIQIRDQCTYSAPQYIFATQSTLHVPTDVPAFIIFVILLSTTWICVA